MIPRRVTSDVEPLRESFRHGLHASKALGQNFILDRQLLARIAALPRSPKTRRFMKSARARRVDQGIARRRSKGGGSGTGSPLPAGAGGTRAGL